MHLCQQLQQRLPFTVLKLGTYRYCRQRVCASSCNSAYRLRYWNFIWCQCYYRFVSVLQQYLPLAVLKLNNSPCIFICECNNVATVLIVYGIETLQHKNYIFVLLILVVILFTICDMRRRARGSREAKRRWGPHISSSWLKGRENKGDKVTVLIVYGIK